MTDRLFQSVLQNKHIKDHRSDTGTSGNEKMKTSGMSALGRIEYPQDICICFSLDICCCQAARIIVIRYVCTDGLHRTCIALQDLR